MNGQFNNPDKALNEINAHKIKMQDNKLAELEQRLDNIPEKTIDLKPLTDALSRIEKDIFKASGSWNQLEEISGQLRTCARLMQVPKEPPTVRHPYFFKLVLSTAGLFLLVCLLCSGWYMTKTKLDNYIANDTKYRYMKLDSSKKALQIFMMTIDSFYNANTEMRKNVLAQEEQNRLNFERLQQAAILKAEAKDLEEKAKKK